MDFPLVVPTRKEIVAVLPSSVAAFEAVAENCSAAVAAEEGHSNID